MPALGGRSYHTHSLHLILVVLVCIWCALATVSCLPVKDVKEDEFVETCTKTGIVRGRRRQVNEDLDLVTFLGIPYAAPPVGDLRFSKPAPVPEWEGVRDALNHGAKCLQKPSPPEPILENVPFSENCLYLDVYLPRSRNESFWDSPLAVMMFIHGGSFVIGTGAKYNFTNLALKGVIVVTINYRLGVFGFLSTEDDVIPGNYGMMDMVMALDWIKDNIESFGGNPDKITSFGGSAGATSSSLLSLSPLTRGKLQGIITQSGTSISFWGVRNPKNTILTSLGIAKSMGQVLNCTTAREEEMFSTALLECLRLRSADQILDAAIKLKEISKTGEIPLWCPVVENTFGFLPELPIKLLRDPRAVLIPAIRGYTIDDGSLLTSDPENDGITKDELLALLDQAFSIYFPGNFADSKQALMETYLRNVEAFSPMEIRKIAIKLLTDITFFSPTILEAIFVNDCFQKAKSYVYELDIRPSFLGKPAWKGVTHESEKGFVLDLPQGPDPYAYPNYTEVDSEIADTVSTLWANFAKYGSPTSEEVDGLIWHPFIVSEGRATDNDGARCDSSSESSPFKPNLRYAILKINTTVTMAPFDKCDELNFYTPYFNNPLMPPSQEFN